jgi:phenylpropionate dioxygenase-like ring-hydroxylating dioxygenase large terminal subunit
LGNASVNRNIQLKDFTDKLKINLENEVVMETQDETIKKVEILETRISWLPNRWYGVFLSGNLKNKPRQIKRFGLDLVLFRDSRGIASCLVDVCPHRGVELSAGKIIGDNLVCPYHGFQFDGKGICHKIPCNETGKQIPATMKAGYFQLREENSIIWLWWGESKEEDRLPKIPWFNDIEVKEHLLSRVSFEWASSFHKTIDANLDHHHAPILHASGKGSLSKQVEAHNFKTKIENEELLLTGRLQEATHDGSFNKKGYDLEARILSPGTSYIRIGKYINLIVVDCPIDDTNTHRINLYLNHFFKIPILGGVIIKLFSMVDIPTVQKGEDEPVVHTMDRYPDFAERLVGADVGIIQIRRLRKMLMDNELKNFDKFPFWVQRQLRKS